MNEWTEIADESDERNRTGFSVFGHLGIATVVREKHSGTDLETIELEYARKSLLLQRIEDSEKYRSSRDKAGLDSGVLNSYRTLIQDRQGLPVEIKVALLDAIDTLGEGFPMYTSSAEVEANQTS